jgi:5'-nucleotidase
MSRNHPDVCLRVFNSIKHHDLDISRAALTGGALLAPYLKAFDVDLFLSPEQDDVQWAANQGCAAGRIYCRQSDPAETLSQIRIAFDGDCVLFSNEAQRIYDTRGLEAFFEHESENARRELSAGPFDNILKTLARIQDADPANSPVRIALVTDRNNPAHERALRTLRAWNVRIDEAFFLGGVPKAAVLEAFGAHIFFDDQPRHCVPAAPHVNTVQVLLPLEPMVTQATGNIEVAVKAVELPAGGASPDRFVLICKGYLGEGFSRQSSKLKAWYVANAAEWDDAAQCKFLDELEVSASNTQAGLQRRSAAQRNTQTNTFMSFLERLAKKHRRSRP